MKGYTRDGRVTKNHPMIKFYLGITLMLRDGKELTLARTIDGAVVFCPITYIGMDYDPYGRSTPNLWIDFKVGEKIEGKTASMLDLQLLLAQAKKIAGVK